jgi:hypothetical protein
MNSERCILNSWKEEMAGMLHERIQANLAAVVMNI